MCDVLDQTFHTLPFVLVSAAEISTFYVDKYDGLKDENVIKRESICRCESNLISICIVSIYD